jgi:hypothetical protein
MKKLLLGLVSSVAITSAAWAQPTLPPATTTPTSNLWSFICPTPDQKMACKLWWCNTALGQLVNGASGPVGMATGGLMGGRCEKTAIDNAIATLPPESAGGAAAAIKKDEADAAARRAAVRYLGTVDCNYWPKASEALRLSLRADPNECVRFEAALALGNGCCCTNEIVKALEMSVTGSKADGFPAERSERVRAAAAAALARCPLVETIIEKDKIDIKKTEAPSNPKDYYAKVAQLPRGQVTASAKAALMSLQTGGRVPMTTSEGDTQMMQTPPIHRRPGNLFGVLSNATVIARPEQAVPMTPMATIEPERPMPIVVQNQPKPPAPNSLPTLPPVTNVSGLKVELKSPVPATNPNVIRQQTGWVTVETPPATIGAPMPVSPLPFQRK